MTTLLVNAFGVLLMLGIVWWFWIAGHSQAIKVQDGLIDIRVAEGVYTPDRIAMSVGETVQLRFTRQDPSPCAALVQFEGLSISRELPVEEPVTLAVRYDQPGEYAFTCQMGMYRGQVVVT
jgi:plastocyanin domain-containing protein